MNKEQRLIVIKNKQPKWMERKISVSNAAGEKKERESGRAWERESEGWERRRGSLIGEAAAVVS